MCRLKPILYKKSSKYRFLKKKKNQSKLRIFGNFENFGIKRWYNLSLQNSMFSTFKSIKILKYVWKGVLGIKAGSQKSQRGGCPSNWGCLIGQKVLNDTLIFGLGELYTLFSISLVHIYNRTGMMASQTSGTRYIHLCNHQSQHIQIHG